MDKKIVKRTISMALATLFLGAAMNVSAGPVKVPDQTNVINKALNLKKVTPADRKKAAKSLQQLLVKAGLSALPEPMQFGEMFDPETGYLIPDYFGSPNWAYSPTNMRKFVDELPGFGSGNANALGQYIPVAVPDKNKYPADPVSGAKASDYYEIAVVEYLEKMHSDLPATKNRGYVQIDTNGIPGAGIPLFQADGTTPIYYPNVLPKQQVRVVDKPHYLGPAIVSDSDRPVRVKFYNLLPIGSKGDLFIPVDTSVMGSGMGPDGNDYTQNRADVHLHGNNTVWISDGSPHQWITPADEVTPYPEGTTVVGVPDMDDPNNPRDGTTTIYYTNSQSARLMFYHDHSYGITRLNVYAGEAAPYIIRDDVEKDLMNGTNLTGVNPNAFKLPAKEIPLVLQDRTFVDATTVLETDPTWAWGSKPAIPATATTPYVPGEPVTGDLWYPHVYSPAQNPYDITGAAPYGRWMYGPWFYPPTKNIANPPVPNPYHDPEVDPLDPTYRPPLMPGTPHPSAPGESFMDTPIVNGTAYPYLNVDPDAYRFRILNASNDRFFNLSLYVADDSYSPGDAGYLTEVKMTAATPGTLPTHITQIMPDPGLNGQNLGPSWIQIASEGGFLPKPAIIAPQPTTWNLVGTAFNFGNVADHSLLLGTAERADVIVDFSQYAGKTLILYNDAPAPFPANDTRYDYFTGNPNQEEIGGAPTTLPGYGPNTRTIMQIKVGTNNLKPAFDTNPLFKVFAKGSIPATATVGANTGVFATGQDTIIMPQAQYNEAYGVTNLPRSAATAYVQLHENSKTFTPINREGVKQSPVTLQLEPKAMHDEMSGVFDEYGRMSGFLGLTSPKASSVAAPFMAFGYTSPPVELFLGMEDDLDAVQIGSEADGTQIWQITHNGVDTHTIHTHLFSSQLINRVAWDGAMIPPDDNELGWKDTVRVNPLEQTVIAMRPKVPAASEIPFAVPNSVRLIDPTMPAGMELPAPPPEGWFDPQGNILRSVVNHEVNFGWEYVYHCHILSHEEMDMMHAMAVNVKPQAPLELTLQVNGNSALLNWQDKSANETGFEVQRGLSSTGPWTVLSKLPANTTSFTHPLEDVNQTYYFKVNAINVVGDTETPGFQTITTRSNDSNIVSSSPATPVVEVIAGTTRFETAQQISSAAYVTADTVVLVKANNFPDALTAGPLAFALNAPILLTNTDTLNQVTKNELIRLQAKKVIIMGGPTAINAAVENELKLTYQVERIGGTTRYDTSILVAERLKVLRGTPSKIVVTSGVNFPDALSAGSYAAKNGFPLLLTNGQTLRPQDVAFITGNGIKDAIIMGGPAVVSAATQTNLVNLGVTVERIFGANREETSSLMATKYFATSVTAIVANGWTFPDALAATPYAAQLNAPILLVKTDTVNPMVKAYLENSPVKTIFVVGGDLVISPAVRAALLLMIQ